MSGKPGRSGRKLGSIEASKLDRNRAILAYYQAGHTMRLTAKAYRLHPSRIGQIVQASREGDAVGIEGSA